MKVFSLLAAAANLIAAVLLVRMLAGFQVMYAEMGAQLTGLSALIINTRGWVVAGPLLVLGAMAAACALAKYRPGMLATALLSATVWLVSVPLVALALVEPLVRVVREIDQAKPPATPPATPPAAETPPSAPDSTPAPEGERGASSRVR